MAAFRLMLVGMVAAGGAGPAFAQTGASLTIAGGSSTDARGIRSNALTAAPSISIVTGARSALSLGASGTTFQSDAWALGANALILGREPLGRHVAIAWQVGGSFTTTSYDVSYARGDVLPSLELTVSALTLFGGAHAIGGATTMPAATGPGPLPFLTPGARVTRSSIAPVYGAQLRVRGLPPDASFTLWAREEPMRIEDETVTDRSGGATLRVGALGLTAMAGRRRARDERVDFSSGAVSLALSPSVVFEVAGGTYPSDRFTGAASGRFVTAGFQIRFGASAGYRAMPAPNGAPALEAGFTRFALRAPDANRVELMGDWTGWKPVATERAANGVWYVDVRLAPGEYRYAFRVNGSEWRVPDGAPAVDDGFGAKSAYIAVRGAGSAK